MKSSLGAWGGWSAIGVGVLSVLYAVFYLVVSQSPDDTGRLISWAILALSGILTSVAYVALYERLKKAGEGFALWAMALGVAQSALTLINGVYQAILISSVQSGELSKAAFDAARALPAPADPKGAATFLIFAISSYLFGRLILGGNTLPRNLGYVGLVNSVLLLLLFLGNLLNAMPLILGSGGLTAIIVTPVWWIGLGWQLKKEHTS